MTDTDRTLDAACPDCGHRKDVHRDGAPCVGSDTCGCLNYFAAHPVSDKAGAGLDHGWHPGHEWERPATHRRGPEDVFADCQLLHAHDGNEPCDADNDPAALAPTTAPATEQDPGWDLDDAPATEPSGERDGLTPEAERQLRRDIDNGGPVTPGDVIALLATLDRERLAALDTGKPARRADR